MRRWTILCCVMALAAAGGCDDDDDTTGAGGSGGAVVVTSGCAQCEPGKECCTTYDTPGCVDTDANPNHCGQCGNACGSQMVCQNGNCVSGEDCSGGAGGCSSGECCQAMGICCPEGTSCVSSVPDFTGCCPVGDVCTCTGANCPISRRDHKEQIRYLTDTDRNRLRTELLAMRLATYRYRGGTDPRTHLGFIIEDVEPTMAADSGHGRVDLYSYASMAVATVQLQQQEIETLRAELATLRRELDDLRR